MNKNVSRLSVLLMSSVMGLSLHGGVLADQTQGHFSTKQPYIAPVSPNYSSPPAGFELISVQHVARHGSRLLSSAKYDDLSQQLWEKAKAENGLTEAGKGFGEILQAIISHHEQYGYGNLSERGRAEHHEIAQRAYARLRVLFDGAAEKGVWFDVLSSGRDRAVDSGLHFVEGLTDMDPALKPAFRDMVFDKDVLYFHDSDEDYLAYLEDDPRLSAAIEEVNRIPEVVDACRKILSSVYTDEFLDRLEAGEINLADRAKGKKFIRDIPSAADSLYNLYTILAGIPELEIDLSGYVSEADAAVLAYATDAEQFYEKGPGFSGETVTYRMALPLLESFFDGIDARLAGGDTAGVFRFAHAEEIIPFAALLRLEGSDVQAPEGELFTYETNPWRGAVEAPMAANIQWDVFSDGKDSHLVRMLYNEKEIQFSSDCTPISGHEYFYELEELRSCLAIGL